jgi:oxygen-independent coproporphyrinogen-3 oxidase
MEKYMRAMENQDMEKFGSIARSEAFGADCVDAYHVNTFEDSASEYVFTALRTKEGVQFVDFEEKFGRSFWGLYGSNQEEFDEFVRRGFAISDNEHIALTKKGISISNRIMSIFV